MKLLFPPPCHARSKGFTLMEILVVIAIILVLAAIAFPVYTTVQSRANKATALNNLRQLGSAAGTFISQNDGQLPGEDAKGSDSWTTAALPDNAKVWYNALPVLLGQKAVGQYVSNPGAFYTKENILYIPGAQYPDNDKKLASPMFAVAINSRLQRKDVGGEKGPTRIAQIVNPSRTVLFLESGLPKEKKAMDQQPKYDGAPKGSAKSFVARYGGVGIVAFIDGHAEAIEGSDILEKNGDFKFPVQPGDIVWTKSPDENPNK